MLNIRGDTSGTYGINVARHLWTEEELANNRIEGLTSRDKFTERKTFSEPLDIEKISLLKSFNF